MLGVDICMFTRIFISFNFIVIPSYSKSRFKQFKMNVSCKTKKSEISQRFLSLLNLRTRPSSRLCFQPPAQAVFNVITQLAVQIFMFSLLEGKPNNVPVSLILTSVFLIICFCLSLSCFLFYFPTFLYCHFTYFLYATFAFTVPFN